VERSDFWVGRGEVDQRLPIGIDEDGWRHFFQDGFEIRREIFRGIHMSKRKTRVW
jgi:hypothetical protein